MIQSIIEFYENNLVDNDFDENFYANKYPDTESFYQPYCSNYGINNRHRLFYHYHFYGAKNYKNQKEYDESRFISNVSIREHKEIRKIAVITSFFNPCNYINLQHNYITFSNHIKQHAELFPIELSFNNNFFIRDENLIKISGSRNNICWQKELLLNIVLDRLPSCFTDIAWIDCDIIMNDQSWVDQVYLKLNNYKVVHLFNEGCRLDHNGNKNFFSSLVSNYPNGESGFAWAARREVLDQIHFLDNQILGGGDYIMASAFMNKPEMLSKLNNYNYNCNKDTKKWIDHASSIVDGSVGFINNSITHLYHGDLGFRNYSQRYDLLSVSEISEVHKDSNGLWSVGNSDNILNYFYSRKEDDNLNLSIHINQFLNTNFLSHEHLLDFYITYICDSLTKTNPDIIQKVKFKINNSIIQYAKQYSNIYKNHTAEKIYTRCDFVNKNEWLCDNISKNRIVNQNTSGSTTGEPFHYYNDNKYFDIVQRNSEFDLILKEYNLYNKPLKILNLFKHPYNPSPKEFYVAIKNHSQQKFHNYGSLDAETYFVNWDGYIEKSDDWHDKLLELLSQNTFDVVLCSGPVINILVRHIKKNNFYNKFAYLLSHTTEFPRISDFEFLKNNRNIEYYCDHMRCWDGGASFFTCKHGTYHLNENFAHVTQGPDNKLLSNDYFNIVAPFINYWNGDLCEIQNEYHLCKCGRYYRPFRMLQNRPFALKGPTKLVEIKKQISNLLFKNKINQVQFENLSVNIYSDEKLDDDEKAILDEILKDYKTSYF